MVDEQVLKAILATAEIMGKQLSAPAASIFCEDLTAFSPMEVLQALKRCRMELKFFPSVAEIIARIEDGRPGPDEAWARIPKSEDDSALLTDEMFKGWDACRTLIAEGDTFGARKAFVEVYTTQITKARNNHQPVRWCFSPGLNKHHRNAVLIAAVDQKLITDLDARLWVHDYAEKPKPVTAQIAGPTHSFVSSGDMIADILKMIENKAKTELETDKER